MKLERNMKDNDALRDSFKEEQLHWASEAATIVSALISLGFNTDSIKMRLESKYLNQAISERWKV
jgi:uncharacterized protein YukE